MWKLARDPDQPRQVVQRRVIQPVVQERSTTLQLTTNFRLPKAVLRLEQALVGLIEANFNDSIDTLAAEKAFVPGLPPTIYEDKEPQFDDFLAYFGSVLSEEQAVLVRDPDQVEELRSKDIGGHVLTIEDSKGLDFHDIIVYNFFSESSSFLVKALREHDVTLDVRLPELLR